MARNKRHRNRAARSRKNLARKQSSAHRTHGSIAGLSARTLKIEQLEDRRMLAVFTVTTELDLLPDLSAPESGSLRQAIVNANAAPDADTILFADNVSFIQLQDNVAGDFGELEIKTSMTFLGSSPKRLTINAAGGNRVFNINDTDDKKFISVEISGVTLSGGNPTGTEVKDRQGGAIFNYENLSIAETIITGNSATAGGGGIFTHLGNLSVERSLISNNTSIRYGGGIYSGKYVENSIVLPTTTTITNSTITGNSVSTLPNQASAGYGGGFFNRFSNLYIQSSTISGNTATRGGGVANSSYEEPSGPGPNPPQAFTRLDTSIVYGNTAGSNGFGSDVDAPGLDAPAMGQPIIAFFGTKGYNIVGRGPDPNTGSSLGDPLSGWFRAPSDLVDVIANPGLDIDPLLTPLLDRGGSTPVFLLGAGSPAIDSGAPGLIPGVGDTPLFDQRGRHFTRIFGSKIDRGAAEMQDGNFVVDILFDGADDIFSTVSFGNTLPGNFSIREARDFAEKNPGADTISFSTALASLPDPKPFTPAPTILLDVVNGALNFTESVNIVGPNFPLEIDGDNSIRIFNFDDGNDNAKQTVSISDLILLGGNTIGSGGAIFSRENLTLTRSSIESSSGTLNGGAIFTQFGDLSITDSTLSSNAAASKGGALYIDGTVSAGGAVSNVTISNSTISGNTAGNRGAGIFNRGPNTVVQYSTITLNSSASTLGSGIVNFTDGTILVRSSIVAGNLNNDIEKFGFGASTIVSGGYNLIGNGNAAFVFTAPGDINGVLDPRLAPLAFGGGLTKTHILLGDSPAIDAGNLSPPNVPVFDQRGTPFVRVFGSRIDIGAYELQGLAHIVDSPGDGSDGNFSFGQFTLREAIELSNLSPLEDVIQFSPILNGDTINVLSPLSITDTVSIVGNEPSLLSITGGFFTTLVIDDGSAASTIDVNITDLTFLGGFGGFIFSQENLTLGSLINRDSGVVLTGNAGGAVRQQNGSLAVIDSIITGNSNFGPGGAFNVQNSAFDITYSTLSGNSTIVSEGHGGAIYLKNTTLNGDMTYITSNTTPSGDSDGAGIFADNSTVVLDNSIVSGNTTTGSNSEGGGISGLNSNFTLNNTIVALNKTTGTQSKGGGIYLYGGSLTLGGGSLISQNTTEGLLAHGGGIANHDGTVAVNQSSVSLNATSGDLASGGGIYNLGGNLTVRDSTINGNSVTGISSDGGGVFSDGESLGKTTLILNSTISGNSTLGNGGGLFNAGGTTKILYSTITANDAPFVGNAGGVGSYGKTSTTSTKVDSSIIAKNSTNQVVASASAADFSGDNEIGGIDFLSWQLGFGKSPAIKTDGDANSDQVVDATDLSIWEANFGAKEVASDVDRVGGTFDETFLSLGYNLVGDGLSIGAFNAAGDQAGVDPLLGILTNNGGPTQTHALLAESPAVNAGKPAIVPANFTPPLDFDQRGAGFDREIGGQIDIGAYESPFLPPPPLPATAPPTSGPQVASDSFSQPIIAASQVDTPLSATSAEAIAEEIQGISSWLANLTTSAASPFRSAAQELNTDSLSASLDELEVVARDALLARLAHLSDGFGQLAYDLDLGNLGDSLHSEGPAAELVVEDFVFESLGQELL